MKMSKDLNRPHLKKLSVLWALAELVKTTSGYAPGDSAITDSFMVRCRHCFARTENRSSDVRMNEYGIIEVRKNGAEEVIQLWNRRTKFDLVDYPESKGK